MGLEAILLPGAVMPADLAYGALLDALGDDVQAIAKDLEVYRGPEPPPDYTLGSYLSVVTDDTDAPNVLWNLQPVTTWSAVPGVPGYQWALVPVGTASREIRMCEALDLLPSPHWGVSFDR